MTQLRYTQTAALGSEAFAALLETTHLMAYCEGALYAGFVAGASEIDPSALWSVRAFSGQEELSCRRVGTEWWCRRILHADLPPPDGWTGGPAVTVLGEEKLKMMRAPGPGGSGKFRFARLQYPEGLSGEVVLRVELLEPQDGSPELVRWVSLENGGR